MGDEKTMGFREFLNSAKEAHYNAARCSKRLKEMETRCEQITTRMSGMPSGGGDRHGDGVWAALADLKSLWVTMYGEAVEKEKALEEFITRLDDMDHRMILRLRYVDRLLWPEVQRQMEIFGVFYSERQMYRLHKDALKEARNLWLREHEVKEE